MEINFLLKLASDFERLSNLFKFAKGKYDHIDFKPSESVAKAAARGLELRKKNKGRGGLNVQQAAKQGIGSGVARAVSLKNRQTLSPATVKRMKAFFDRHEKSAKVDAGKTPGKDKGYIAWLLWGGNAGRSWANKVCRQMEAADRKGKGKRKVASIVQPTATTDLKSLQEFYIERIRSAKDQVALDKVHDLALYHVRKQESKDPVSAKSFKDAVNLAYADRLNELLDIKNAHYLNNNFFKWADPSTISDLNLKSNKSNSAPAEPLDPIDDFPEQDYSSDPSPPPVAPSTAPDQLTRTQLEKVEKLRRPGFGLGPFDRAAEYAKESLLKLPPSKRDRATDVVEEQAHKRFSLFNPPTDQKIIDLINDIKRMPEFAS